MKLIVEAPLNSLSFGNVAFNIIRELHKKDVEIGLFPTGEPDFSAYELADDLKEYIERSVNKKWDVINPHTPCLKLWHLNGSEKRRDAKTRQLFPLDLTKIFFPLENPTLRM